MTIVRHDSYDLIFRTKGSDEIRDVDTSTVDKCKKKCRERQSEQQSCRKIKEKKKILRKRFGSE